MCVWGGGGGGVIVDLSRVMLTGRRTVARLREACSGVTHARCLRKLQSTHTRIHTYAQKTTVAFKCMAYVRPRSTLSLLSLRSYLETNNQRHSHHSDMPATPLKVMVVSTAHTRHITP